MIESRHTSNRNIIKRIIVRCNLILDTPTCLGSGDTDSPLDFALLRDSATNHALLTGSSIGGSLRNFLREYNCGYNIRDHRNDIATKLFGDLFAYDDEIQLPENEKIKLKENDTQSLLIINDAISTTPIQAELRDCVKINSVTRTAVDKAKYDLELLESGTEFHLCFELLIVEKDSDEEKLKKALALALHGLESEQSSQSGEICIGMKKHRGFGRCHVEKWQVWQFDLRQPDERVNWLKFEHWSTGLLPEHPVHDSIATALGISLDVSLGLEDKRERLTIEATFTLASPLLIRSGQASDSKAPDVVHLKSKRDGELQSILSGTALAGVLRHRAERIVNTLQKKTSIIDEIFGPDFSHDKTKQAKASRLIVNETVITETTDLVQTRIAIDRFTGGALHGALFQEQPIFGSDNTKLVIKLELRKPECYEIGLLLLLLKDLWTGDLPVGGTSSIGRGRLQGQQAIISLPWKNKIWKISQAAKDEPLIIDDAESLQEYVDALNKEVAA